MAISCAYCGGSHPTPAEVRACWQRSQQVDDFRPAEPQSAVAAPAGSQTSIAAPTGAPAGPGPDALARNIVVGAGGAVLEPWAASSRMVIDAAALADPGPVVAALRGFAERGERVVIELQVPFHESPRSIDSSPPYSLGARFWFPLDVLHHMVWSNSVDATGERPVWRLLDAAIGLGATPVADGAGDVVLADSQRVWLDGGRPRRRGLVDGLAVLHSISIEHRSLLTPFDRDSTAELADDQRAAVNHHGAAARVIAPAGSGKTRVLTERARHLLDDWRTPPGGLTLVAFNKRAQEEMQSRTTDLRGLQVRTLNAIALAIVNGSAPFASQPRTRRTIDEPEVRNIIGQLVQFPRKRNIDPVAVWIEALSSIRLGLRQPADVEDDYDGDVAGLVAVWPRYRAELERMGALDFDEQIYAAIDLLLRDPDARAAAQRACRLLLVDEFQDLTPAHVLLVRLLSAPGFDVFGVGDDDQTIYGFSGADPAWLIEFESLFPNAALHPLEVNYRCPGDVVAAADRLVRHNHRRVAKTIRAARPTTTGLQIVGDAEPLHATTAAVRVALDEGRAAGDIAVLTRVNAMLAPVQVALASEGVPVVGGVGLEFLERTTVRSALSWLRLAMGGPDRLASSDLAEALRRPSRPMHPNVAKWVVEQSTIAGLRRLAGRVNNERDADRVAAFAADIERLQGLSATSTTADVFQWMTDELGLRAAVATLDGGRRGMNRGSQSDDLVALAQLATLQPDPARFGSWLRDQLTVRRSPDGVTLATVHRVKGQEWPVVVLHHSAADQYPHRLAEDVEEERRVFHVAITRGAERVVVVGGPDPSPFIEELRNEPPERQFVEPSATVRSSRPKAPARDSVFVKGDVLAAPGVVLADAGQEWRIESVDSDGVTLSHGRSSRRVLAGAKVITAGRQQGRLVLPTDSSPSAASIRALDLLRRARELLRDGKPAYVVFHDATIERIALSLPTSPAELRMIEGIGASKLEQYGDAVLLAVEDALGDPDDSETSAAST